MVNTMSIGQLTSSAIWSTLKYTGSAITNRFYTTLANQELILFLDKESKQVRCNSITVEADATDIYFTVVRAMDSPSTFVFTNEPILACKAYETLAVNGVEIIGIKLSNALGAKLYCAGTRF